MSIDTLYPRPVFKPLYPFLSPQQRQLRNNDLQRYLASFPKINDDELVEYELEGVTVTARNPNRPRMSVNGNLYDTTNLVKFKQVPLLQYVSFLPKVMRSGNQLLGRVVGGGWIPIGLTVNRMNYSNIDYLRDFTVGDVEYINVVIPLRVEIYLKPGAGIKPDFSIYKTIGYSENAEFYHPIYDTPEKVNDKTPDHRTTLYWNPYVKFGPDGKSKIEFYSGDSDNSQYEITIEGVTSNGSICQHQQKIQ